MIEAFFMCLHAERVSASMAQARIWRSAEEIGRPWMPEQVQDDGSINGF